MRAGSLVVALFLLACGRGASKPGADGGSPHDGSAQVGDDGGGSADMSQMRVGETGKPCEKNSDCMSGICLPVGQTANVDAGTTGNVCTTPCTMTTDCVSGWSCMALIGQTSNVCQCQSAGSETCNGNDDDCDGIVDNAAAVTAECAVDNGTGWVCNAGTCACESDGKCMKLVLPGTADFANNPAFTVDNQNIYWIDDAGPHATSLSTASQASGAVSTYGAWDLTIMNGTLYYMAGNSSLSDAPLYAWPIASPSGTAPTTVLSPGFSPSVFALDSNNVYYTTESAIMTRALSGGAASVIASNTYAPALTLVGANLCWISWPMIVNAGQQSTGSLQCTSTATVGVQTIESNLEWPYGPYVDPSSTSTIYWLDVHQAVNQPTMSVFSAALTGGTPTSKALSFYPPLFFRPTLPSSAVFYKGSLYTAGRVQAGVSTDAIYHVDLASGTSSIIWDDGMRFNPMQIVPTDSLIYFNASNPKPGVYSYPR